MNPPLMHWIPYKLVKKNQEYKFEWIYLGENRFKEPFFEQTISKCRSLHENSQGLKVISHSQAVLEWSQQIKSVKPLAFIFHISRCGSTMLSQAITTTERNIVIPEIPVLDEILRDPDMPEHLKNQLFMAVLKFLGQIRFPNQQNLILKMDSWHLMYLEQLRTYFPALPFLILTREPEAVLKSHKRNRGMQMVPGLLPLSMFGITKDLPTPEKLDDYAAWVLKKYYLAIEQFRQTDKSMVLCDYSQGFEQIIKQFLEITLDHFSAEETRQIDARLKKHSKNPESTFSGDADLTIEIEQIESLQATYALICSSIANSDKFP
jgi:hypothetical protein